jgi:peptidoglycan/xylan/chitin deacetylase (PgdA/CDA1 family)
VDLPTDGPKLVALTFDLCEQPNEVAGYQGAVVDFLRENSVRATCFAGGKWMLSHRMRAQQLMTDPLFEFGNHSWGHSNLRLLTGERLRNEIAYAGLAYYHVREALPSSCPLTGGDVEALASAAPRQMSLFRFPFGACNHAALEAVDAQGLIPVQWDVSSGDPTLGVSSARIVNVVLSRVRPGSIVLFHANGRGWNTSTALPVVVSELRRRGYQFATISELLSAPGAKPVYSDSCYDSRIGDTDRYDALSSQLEAAYARFTAKYSGIRERATHTRQQSSPTVSSEGAVHPLDPTDVSTTGAFDVLEVPMPRPATRPLPDAAAAR